MGKNRRKSLRYAKCICLGILSALLFYWGLKNYAAMGTEAVAAVELYGEYPSMDRIGQILDDCKKGETITDVCFLWNGGIETLEEPKFSRSTDARVTGIQGAGELYDSVCAALGENDKDGCILDRESAVELFGSESCVGDQLRLGEKIYEVRAVAAWKQHQVVIRTTQKENLCTQVLIRRVQEQSLESTASGFLMGYGLSGTLIDDRWLKMFVSWAPAFYIFSVMLLAKRILNQKKESHFQDRSRVPSVNGEEKERKGSFHEGGSRWIRLVLTAVLWGVGLYLISRFLYISKDWLPDKWSDFSFWPEKIKKEWGLIRWYMMFPKTMAQTERLFAGIGCIVKCGAATFLVNQLCSGRMTGKV